MKNLILLTLFIIGLSSITAHAQLWSGPSSDTTNIYRSGPVSIGDSTSVPSGYLLSVDGDIITEEVTLMVTEDWPDYVFEEGHQLLTLDEVEKHILEYNHLPGIPSAKDLKEEGVNTSEMLLLQMQKIEELTLYIIERGKQIEALKADLKLLKK